MAHRDLDKNLFESDVEVFAIGIKMNSEQLSWSEQNNRRIIILLRNHDNTHTYNQQKITNPPGRL
jgi:hypothetical protein